MAKKGISATERKLHELLTIALARLQDTEAVLFELSSQRGDISKTVTAEAQVVGLAWVYVQGQLRDIGLPVKVRKPFDADASVAALYQQLVERQLG
ncbi:hypothetical protein J2W28_000972 [Variovorax boronicumulans]|uniref:hypothetical protein n=1 Tax=Variovorax boronicumulans TaxID=436515 RepID=UPI002781C03E|nr:hypothetical protein [Variovorax boronicumulans]MDP9991944.1 hypothetical protein [Variovorax boronicumulans]MDQ0001839.1 hypothetical protein [Variovorax boronicumulans]